uniref:HAT C-terminal dimerisation domain-containing protein n=1 Tax=Ananas comosus var. bracteatus TaxID=296719 RepID=A0A6V7Q0C8_ANACO|nr:unnamed protein product [Ananas comosus var. bracteatus]
MSSPTLPHPNSSQQSASFIGTNEPCDTQEKDETADNHDMDGIENELEGKKIPCAPVDRDDPSKFDVLGWWKMNNIRFRILSKLARDVLSIPITTVASELAFSAGGRVLDDYRSSLAPKMVDALVCAGNWIRASQKFTKSKSVIMDGMKLVILFGQLLNFVRIQIIMMVGYLGLWFLSA